MESSVEECEDQREVVRKVIKGAKGECWRKYWGKLGAVQSGRLVSVDSSNV